MKILKEGREANINERLRKLRSRKGHRYFITHIEFPSRQKELDRASIDRYLKKIEEIIPQIELLIRNYRAYILHIWDQTKFCASYLLICKAFGNLRTATLLAKNGSCQELVEISRSAIEALDLAFLFLQDEKGKLLKDWFKGKIISNDEARKALHKSINKIFVDTTIPLQDVKSDLYETYSLYTHSSYAALLDSIDVFYEDYDFKKYAGYHYSVRYLHLIDNIVINILLLLKSAFTYVKDTKNFEATDKLLRAIWNEDLSPYSIDKLFKDYKQSK